MAQATTSFTIESSTVTVQTFREDLGDRTFLDLVLIPPGKFLMDSPPGSAITYRMKNNRLALEALPQAST